jgi:hypothetical protein
MSAPTWFSVTVPYDKPGVHGVVSKMQSRFKIIAADAGEGRKTPIRRALTIPASRRERFVVRDIATFLSGLQSGTMARSTRLPTPNLQTAQQRRCHWRFAPKRLISKYQRSYRTPGKASPWMPFIP